MNIRTDLALEARESISDSFGKINGIKIIEKNDKKHGINITRMDVLNKYGEECIKKPVGTYITMHVPNLAGEDEDYHRNISESLAGQIKELIIGAYNWKNKVPKILVAGLGNADATPDSLGPRVVSNLMITRHIIEYMDYGEIEGAFGIVSAIVPGVMAQTGMETSEIISAIVKKTEPDILLVIDALAARSITRLNSTIQLADTGIEPGSGVGNHRQAINRHTMGIPVIAIGVPTVVDASTLIYDIDRTSNCEEYDTFYVTPKDIDATIKQISYTISEAINICMGNV